MVEGFKDEDGKFRPTEKKQGISSDDVAGLFDEPSRVNLTDAEKLKNQKGRIKEIRVFKFEELEPDVQEKIIENRRQSTLEFGDTFFSEDDFLIFDPKTKFQGNEIFKNTQPKFFEVDSNRGTDFVQFELDFKEPETESEKKLSKFLGISEALRQKIQFRFINDSTRLGGENNTKLAFRDEVDGLEIDLDQEYKENPTGFDNFAGFPKDATPTREEYKALQDAVEKWDDLISQALQNLTRNFESSISDETLKEDIEESELEFTEDGSPA